MLGAILDNFTPADSSNTRQYGGSGLGLAISRRIAEQMKGTLGVTSELGIGSTFRFTAVFEPGPTPSRTSNPEPMDLSGKRVLIVDEDSVDRRILHETLHAWGMDVAGGATPAAALPSLSQEPSYTPVLIHRPFPEVYRFEHPGEHP